MLKQQTMEVNLSAKNTAILKRPSKLFNSIKSTFSGEMTPTQVAQANVMLSVLQRLNITLKKSDISNLVIIKMNEDIVYSDENSDFSNDIDAGVTKISERLSELKCNRLNSIELLAEGVIGSIKFIVHVSVLRKPQKGDRPIKIKVTGLLAELSKKNGESEDHLAARVKQYVQTKCSTLADVKSEDTNATMVFSDFVAKLAVDIERYFPAGLDKNKLLSFRGSQSNKYSRVYSNGGLDDYHFFDHAFLYLLFSDSALADSLGEDQAVGLADELGWEGPDNLSENEASDIDSYSNQMDTSLDDEITSSWWSSMVDDSSASDSGSSCSSCGGD